VRREFPLRYPLLAAAIAFTLGAGLSLTPVAAPAPAAFLLGGGGTLLLLARCSSSRHPFRWAGTLAAFLAAGLVAPSLRSAPRPVPDPLPQALARGLPVWLEGTVTSLPRREQSLVRFDLQLGRLAAGAAPGWGVRVAVGGGEAGDPARVEELLPGDRLRLRATLRRPRSFHNPGAFAADLYLRRQGIDLLAMCKSPLLVERIGTAAFPPSRQLARLRRALLRPFDARRAAGDGGAGLVAAMVWGERSAVSPETRAALVASGTFHLLAISGMNVALLFAFLLAAARLVGLRGWIAPLAILALLPIYAVLAGASPPILRAAFMGGGLILARFLGRATVAPNTLGGSLLAILVLAPEAAGDAGLQLSALATAALLVLAAPLERRLRGPRWWRRSLAASLAALAGTAPWLARIAHWISPVALVANLAAVPLSAVVVVMGTVGSLLLAAGSSLGTPLLAVAERAADAIMAVAEACARVPGGSWPTPGPSPGVIAAYYALLVMAAAAPVASPLRRTSILLLGLATLCVAVGSPGLPADGRLRLDMLDVGQGDALLLRLPDGAALLIDGGGLTGSTFDLGRQVVVPALWTLGVRRLDLVIGTHPHHDHLGGLAAVVHHLPVEEAWVATGPRDDADLQALRRACLERGTSLRRVVAGVTRRFGETELMVLHPPADVSRRDPNDESIVLVVAWGRERWLLAGDAGARVEAELGEQVGQAGLLKVGHHGSRTATTAAFLARLRPRLALISVGEGNRWRHPDDAVVARLAARGIRVLRTDRDGMVSVTSDGRVRTWQVTRSAAP